MADVTIDQLTNRLASSSSLIPFSEGSTTYNTKVSQITKEFIIPDTGGTPQWCKLGTLTMPQLGFTARLQFYLHAGFNAANSQDFFAELFFKTSNGSSVNASGFGANSWYQLKGFNAHDPIFKWVSNAAGVNASSYDLYLYLPVFTYGCFYTVSFPNSKDFDSGWPQITWTPVNAIGQANPGNDSSTVLVSTKYTNIPTATSQLTNDSGYITSSSLPASQQLAKAWVRWTGTSYNAQGVCTINASYNVSSVVRISTGTYNINWSSAFANANYCVVAGGGGGNPGNNVPVVVREYYTTYCVLVANGYGTNNSDCNNITVAAYSN